MNTCSTCKHWGDEKVAEDRFYGHQIEDWKADGISFCGRILHTNEYRGDADGLQDHPDELAGVEDAEAYNAYLLTRAAFGCVLWEPTA